MFTQALSLPYLLPNQAQKHVTLNESLALLDLHVHMTVQTVASDTPPEDHSAGGVYVVSDTPTGEWQGREGQLAWSIDGAWRYLSPEPGWIAWFEEDQTVRVFDGAAWSSIRADLSKFSQIGVNTDPDAYNRLSVKSESVLFSHDDVTPGSGDVRVHLNRKDENGFATVYWSTGYVADTEIGLTSEGFVLKQGTGDGAMETIVRVNPDEDIAISKSLELSNPLRFTPDAPEDGTLLAVFGIQRAWALEQYGHSSGAALAFRSTSSGAKSILFLDAGRENSIRITPGLQEIRIGNERVVTEADLAAQHPRAPVYDAASLPSASGQTDGQLAVVISTEGSAQLVYSYGAQWLSSATHSPMP